MLFVYFQGILGADGRHYILDLFRTFPTDVNFLEGLSYAQRPTFFDEKNVLKKLTC